MLGLKIIKSKKKSWYTIEPLFRASGIGQADWNPIWTIHSDVKQQYTTCSIVVNLTNLSRRK